MLIYLDWFYNCFHIITCRLLLFDPCLFENIDESLKALGMIDVRIDNQVCGLATDGRLFNNIFEITLVRVVMLELNAIDIQLRCFVIEGLRHYKV